MCLFFGGRDGGWSYWASWAVHCCLLLNVGVGEWGWCSEWMYLVWRNGRGWWCCVGGIVVGVLVRWNDYQMCLLMCDREPTHYIRPTPLLQHSITNNNARPSLPDMISPHLTHLKTSTSVGTILLLTAEGIWFQPHVIPPQCTWNMKTYLLHGLWHYVCAI